MALSAEEKAAKRAQALARLEATRARIAKGPKFSGVAKAGEASSGVSRPPVAAAAAAAPAAPAPAAQVATSAATGSVPGQNKPKPVQSTNRDASARPSGLFSKPYIEYDLSNMKDSKGGFIEPEQANNTWLERLPQQVPPLPLDHPDAPACFECGTRELNFRLLNVFGTRVCDECRRKLPEKYSMLTKTECKQDYLLTEPELRDKEILPHMERPNPHKDNYSNMMLYMRYQAEEFAFKKWGGEEGLDAEYERRETNKVERKKIKFDRKLKEMRKRTRAQAITGKSFDRHQHAWVVGERQANGTRQKRCACGMSVEELAI